MNVVVAGFVGAVLGAIAALMFYRQELAVYDRLRMALEDGEAAFVAEAAKIKNELKKIL